MTPTPHETASADTSDRELVYTRRFEAPPSLVYQAWTEQEHLVHWWGPTGFTITTHEAEVKPGGVWRFMMHGPDGTDYPNRVTFLEVVAPERLVYRHDADADDAVNAFLVTVTFTAVEGGTELSMRTVFSSAAALEKVKPYAVPGAQQTLDRLKAHLATL